LKYGGRGLTAKFSLKNPQSAHPFPRGVQTGHPHNVCINSVDKQNLPTERRPLGLISTRGSEFHPSLFGVRVTPHCELCPLPYSLAICGGKEKESLLNGMEIAKLGWSRRCSPISSAGQLREVMTRCRRLVFRVGRNAPTTTELRPQSSASLFATPQQTNQWGRLRSDGDAAPKFLCDVDANPPNNPFQLYVDTGAGG
jgi:hypothetical protein